jgi:hypothetical protein
VAIKALKEKTQSSLRGASKAIRKRVVQSLTAMCRRETESAMNTIIHIMKDPGAKPGERLKAAEMIIERAHGKVPDQLEIARSLPDDQLRALAEKLLMHRQQLAEKNETIIEVELEGENDETD